MSDRITRANLDRMVDELNSTMWKTLPLIASWEDVSESDGKPKDASEFPFFQVIGENNRFSLYMCKWVKGEVVSHSFIISLESKRRMYEELQAMRRGLFLKLNWDRAGMRYI